MTYTRHVTASLLATVTALSAGVVGLPTASAEGWSKPDEPLRILVLGDSYSAGNGADGTAFGPEGCHRNTRNWGSLYAQALRSQGHLVNLDIRACSGGVTADFANPRSMEDTQTKVAATPAGVTNAAEADAWLTAQDPCNTGRFPDEEMWSYAATAVTPVAMTYTCERFVRPQAEFVDARTDLVLYTMGGNDAGFTKIVTSCFVVATRTASDCRAAVAHARSMVPIIKQRLIAAVETLRAHGLRDDAKVVQLGYPYLQLDNGFTLPDPASPNSPYPAGAAVRSLIRDAMVELGSVPDQVNVGHPGQVRFVTDLTDVFAGHEPDAATTNPRSWIVQQFTQAEVVKWYHPNGMGQQAYADRLLAGGLWGARGSSPDAVTLRLRVRAADRTVKKGAPVTLRLRVRRSDGTAARGRIVVRGPRGKVLASARLLPRHLGHRKVKLRALKPGRWALRVVVRDPRAGKARAVQRVRVRSLS